MMTFVAVLRETLKSTKLWFEQCLLELKYKDMQKEGRLSKVLYDESKKKWQWIESYLYIATPIEHLNIDNEFMTKKVERENQEARQRNQGVPLDDDVQAFDTFFKVDGQWQKMRERHANECMQYVIAH